MKNFSYMQAGMLFSLTLAFAGLPTLTSAADLYRQLQVGMRGSDVGALQTFLAQDATLYPQGLVTDYFGYLTKAAVSNFQSRNGISAVGRVGPQTLPVINAQMHNGGGSVISNNDGRMRVIEQVYISTSNTQATVSWNTGENSVASIYYSTSPLVLNEATEYSQFSVSGGYNMTVSNTLRMSHSGNLTGLTPNTVYYYLISVKDAQGTESITLPATFQTSN